MTRQSQRTRPERRRQIGAEPEVEEAGVDQEDVADLEVDVEEVAEEDFDEFSYRNRLDLETAPFMQS
jgi:hypothetical protein